MENQLTNTIFPKHRLSSRIVQNACFHEVQNNDKVDFSRKISSLDETEYDYRYPLSNNDTT